MTLLCLQVQVSEAGESVAAVSIRCARGKAAVSKVCQALEPLGLGVVMASITAASDIVVHTMFVEVSSRSTLTMQQQRQVPACHVEISLVQVILST